MSKLRQLLPILKRKFAERIYNTTIVTCTCVVLARLIVLSERSEDFEEKQEWKQSSHSLQNRLFSIYRGACGFTILSVTSGPIRRTCQRAASVWMYHKMTTRLTEQSGAAYTITLMKARKGLKRTLSLTTYRDFPLLPQILCRGIWLFARLLFGRTWVIFLTDLPIIQTVFWWFPSVYDEECLSMKLKYPRIASRKSSTLH